MGTTILLGEIDRLVVVLGIGMPICAVAVLFAEFCRVVLRALRRQQPVVSLWPNTYYALAVAAGAALEVFLWLLTMHFSVTY